MSLTSLLKIPSVRAEFAKRVRVPELPSSLVMRVPRKTADPAKMGTALDYGIRFALRRKYSAIHSGKLIAELALHSRVAMQRGTRASIQKIIEQGKMELENATGATESFAYWCFQLANLDIIMRQRQLPKQIPMVPTEHDIREFRALMKIAVGVWYPVERYCLLNPTFGEGSSLVGGADADVVQDGIIIDIKTVAKPNLADVLYQLVGYYVLADSYEVDGLPAGEKITEVAVYFARHGSLIRLPIERLVTPEQVEELHDVLAEAMPSQRMMTSGDVIASLGLDGGPDMWDPY